MLTLLDNAWKRKSLFLDILTGCQWLHSEVWASCLQLECVWGPVEPTRRFGKYLQVKIPMRYLGTNLGKTKAWYFARNRISQSI